MFCAKQLFLKPLSLSHALTADSIMALCLQLPRSVASPKKSLNERDATNPLKAGSCDRGPFQGVAPAAGAPSQRCTRLLPAAVWLRLSLWLLPEVVLFPVEMPAGRR